MAIKFGRPLEAKVRFSPVEADRPRAGTRLDLTARPRRNRRSEWVRRLVCEHVHLYASCCPGRTLYNHSVFR